MAIESMSLLQIVGSIDEMHSILKKLIMCENVHLNLDTGNLYNNSYLVLQYESNVIGEQNSKTIDYDKIDTDCSKNLQIVEELCYALDVKLVLDNKFLTDDNYHYTNAENDLMSIKNTVGNKSDEIKDKRQLIGELLFFKEIINSIFDKTIKFENLENLKYFDYEIGLLSNENNSRLKKNYENLSAIVLKIGSIKSSVEDLYLIMYPKQYKEETNNILKSLSWRQLHVPEGIYGNPQQMIDQMDNKIEILKNEIKELTDVIELDKEENKYILNKIYNTLKLEEKIVKLVKNIDFGENLFIINVWVKENDKAMVEEAIGTVTNKFIVTDKSARELGKQVKPPTKLKNNWFTKPFELIVKMYGLPAYNEIDPTPFLAITFCLMFGIMFGDIGQGLVYFIAGLLLYKRMKDPGAILMRLGGSSIIFGFVYGSLFGLEQAELPWLPSLIGRPLDPKNKPMIILTGVIVGIVVLTISFVFGIINSLRRGDVEEGIFGKNGIAGYIFFMSMVMTAVSITGAISLPIIIPVTTLIASLIVMILKVPVTNLILGKKPLIHGDVGSYFTESIFEGVETILNALSNGISFIRVGAFALNHAGLFLAFLVMSELTTNIILKIIILALGNILILTLEGLVVFIQGLRLQYYEMFSKYFVGDGIEFKPIKLNR